MLILLNFRNNLLNENPIYPLQTLHPPLYENTHTHYAYYRSTITEANYNSTLFNKKIETKKKLINPNFELFIFTNHSITTKKIKNNYTS